MAATVARKVLNAMVAAEHDLVDGIRQREIKRMPQVMRLAHPKAIRHMSCIGIGWGLCLAGSWIAHHADTWPLVGHTWWDAIGYTVHAFGAIPIVGHGERLWALLRA